MTQIGEAVAIAMADEIVDECPFPHEDVEHKEKNDLSNNAAVLGGHIGGGSDRRIDVTVRGTTKGMDLGFQAHHLIPGASIKAAKSLKKYISEGSTVKADIGYEQNDRRNGVWLPGLHRFEGWGALGRGGGFEIQFAYAYSAMTSTGRQFHMWDSSHADYNRFVRRALEEMRLKMLEIRSGCSACEERSKKPWDPPYQMVDMLYALSSRMKGYVTGAKSRWMPPYCTSDFAVLVGAGYTPEKMASL